tara:strand:+ start:391 stop:684 length:294 start_codon:yes stop_codon:yes gene_type:complete
MKYMNIVRFKVKKDCVNDYIEALNTQPSWNGNIEGRTVQTGENTFCGYGLWESKEAMDAEMESMIGWLDTVRDMLEEISPELGVTDPVSGPVIWEKQ